MALCHRQLWDGVAVRMRNNSSATYGLFVEDKGAIFEGNDGEQRRQCVIRNGSNVQ